MDCTCRHIVSCVWWVVIAAVNLVPQSVICQLDPSLQFTNVDFVPSQNESSNLVAGFVQDDRGYLWIASLNGLYRYDGAELKPYMPAQDSTSISSQSLSSIFIDWHGRIWIGTRGNGLDLYDPVLDQFHRDYDPLRNDLIIWNFFQQDSNTLWIGARHFLIHYDLSKNQCEYYKVPQMPWHYNAVRYVTQNITNPNELWLGTLFGLYSFDKTTGQFKSHGMPEQFVRPRKTEGDYLLMDVFQADGTSIWASSWGGGVVNFNPRTEKWTRYQNLPEHTDPRRWDYVIFDMIPWDDRQFWVATSHGFGTFDTKSATYTMFPEGDPPKLKHSFNYDGIGKTSDGRVVVGRYGGFSISRPFNTNADPVAYPPEIRNIEIDERIYPSDTSTSFLREVAIDENEKDIALEIASPGIFDKSQILYSYKLEGYDHNWQVSDGPIVRYTNLGPGKYTLRARISVDEGNNWTYLSHPLRIVKSGYPWQNPWFYALCLLVILLITGVIYWINIRAIKATARLRSDYDKRIAGIEMAALRAQMNPHFMFNSLNSIKTYILKEKTEEASEYLNKFSLLMRAVLRNSKDPLVTLEDELNALKLYVELEALRFEDEFEYTIDIDPSIDTASVVIPPLLVQPYVENAIRHGLLEKEEGKKHLLIRFTKANGGGITIVVEDNGIGRKAASRRQPLRSPGKRSFGMEITGDRIALIEQTLGIQANVQIIDLYDNGNPSGTRVEMKIPHIPVSETLT